MSQPAPVRVRLRYADLESFIERFAPNVTRGGIFLASRTPRPVGELFPFEVQLATGQVALAGEGKVIWVKEFDPAQPQKPHGMGVQFTRLDETARATLNRMLKVKAAGGVRSPSQPVRPLQAPGGAPANGSGAPRQRIDTSVDLASEYGLDEAALRRSMARGRLMTPARGAEEELDELCKPDAAEQPATLAQALSELPRLLDPNARRRTGAVRTLEVIAAVERAAAAGDATDRAEPVTTPPARDDPEPS